jgi:hypothetical protein
MIHPLRHAAILAVTTTFAFTAPADAGIANPATATSAAAVVGSQAVQDCPVGFACLWTSLGWAGQRWQGNNRNNTLPAFIDNKSRSWANHDLRRVACFWTDPNGQGMVLALPPGSIIQNPGENWANSISSLTWEDC